MPARSALKRLGLVFAASVALTLLLAGVALAEPRIKTKGCEIYDTNRVDPIARMEHLHHQFGNTSTTNESTGEGLLDNASTSCDTDWFTTAGWFPVERDEPVKGIAVYYRALGDQTTVKEIPEGLQLLGEEVKYNCTKSGEGTFEETPPYGCTGDWTTRVEFPDCWNTTSKEEDATVYSEEGVCPPTHPHRIPQISYLIQHANADGEVPEPLMVSAGVDAWEPHTSMHADYFAANQPDLNDQLIGRCLRDAPDGATVAHESCGTEGGTPAPEGSVPQTLEPTTEPESTTPEAAPPEGTTPETPTGSEEGTSTEEGACTAGRVVMSGSGSGEAETPAFSTEGTAIGVTIEPEAEPPEQQPVSATLVEEDGSETTLEHDGAEPASFLVPAEPGSYTARIDSGEVGYRLTVQDCPAGEQ